MIESVMWYEIKKLLCVSPELSWKSSSIRSDDLSTQHSFARREWVTSWIDQ